MNFQEGVAMKRGLIQLDQGYRKLCGKGFNLECNLQDFEVGHCAKLHSVNGDL
jgi:hypothetical protein